MVERKINEINETNERLSDLLKKNGKFDVSPIVYGERDILHKGAGGLLYELLSENLSAVAFEIFKDTEQPNDDKKMPNDK